MLVCIYKFSDTKQTHSSTTYMVMENLQSLGNLAVTTVNCNHMHAYIVQGYDYEKNVEHRGASDEYEDIVYFGREVVM